MVASLIEKARASGVHLYVEDGRLKFASQGGTPSSALLEEVKAHKQALLSYLGALQSGISAADSVPPLTRVAQTRYPLTYAQQRLWFIDRLDGPSSAYNISLSFDLRGPFDSARFAEAVALVAERNDILRTRIVAKDDGGAEQWVGAFDPAAVSMVELDPAESLDAMVEAHARKPFVLDQDCLFRVLLVKVADEHHVGLLSLHHIITDGWSNALLLDGFITAYQGLCAVPGFELPEPSLQYGDYALWQREKLADKAFDERAEQLAAKLKVFPQLHSLPLDHVRPLQLGNEGAVLRARLEKPMLEQAKALCQRLDITLYMLLHSVFALSVARWSGERSLLTGSPVAGRERSELETMLGLFTNTLVLPWQLDYSQSAADWLKAQKATTLSAFANQDIPFDLLVEKVNPARQSAFAPLLQLMFVLQNQPVGSKDLAGLQVSIADQDTGAAKAELALVAKEDSAGLQLDWSYNTGLFVASTIERLQQSFVTLLGGVLTAPEASLGSFDYLPEADRASLTGPQHMDKEGASHIIDGFETQAAAHQDRVAIQTANGAVSYAQLQDKAARLANLLLSKGVQAADTVAVSLAFGEDLAASLLAILRIGAYYLPVDPALPAARKRFMLGDSGARWQLVTGENAIVDEPGTLYLDDEATIAELAALSADCAIEQGQGGYIIYTSGTTGRPKGVRVSQAALASHLGAVNQAYGISAEDKVCQFVSIGFDVAVEQLLLALCHGAEAVAYDRSQDFWAQVEANAITVAALPAQFLASLFAYDDAPARLQASTLRLLASGGEMLDAGVARHWQQSAMAEHCTLLNVYGPTEAVVTATYTEVCGDTGVSVIGQACADKYAAVLDEQMNPVPQGVVGELYIGGQSLAEGYIGQPQLSKERFVVDPQHPSERLYRTGDKVYRDKHNRLCFAGRVDRQVKIRGFRIELDEIEAAMAALDAVAECAVKPVTAADAQTMLVAYVVAQQGQAVDGGMLQAALGAQLPEYMVPAHIEGMTALPLTVNGKVDYDALPEISMSLDGSQPRCPAQTPMQQLLVDIWQSLLGIEGIGIRDDFFRLGGHSLLVTRMLAQLHNRSGLEVALRAVFEHPTIESLAHHIESLDEAAGQGDIQPVGRDEPLPLSFAQERIYLVDSVEGGSAQYNITGAFSLKGALQPELLWQALDALLSRHEVLRTGFYERGGQVFQHIHSGRHIARNEQDLSALTPAQQQDAIEQQLALEAQHNFDLNGDCLFRVTLSKLASDRHMVVFNMHHLVSDGWSKNLLVKELGLAYDAALKGQPMPFEPLKVQYADYAVWQRNWLQSDNYSAERDFWLTRLEGLPQVHALPLDWPRPARQGFDGAMFEQRLDSVMASRLKAYAQQNGLSLFMLLQSTFALLLGRFSGERDIVMGTSVSGRSQQAVAPLIGFFVNTLVLRTELPEQGTFAEYLKGNRDWLLDAFEHQQMPFALLVEALKPERSLSHNPLVQILFSMDNNEQSSLTLGELEIEDLPKQHYGSQFDLELNSVEFGGTIRFGWQYNTALFKPATIELMAQCFEVLLGNILTDDGQSIDAIDLLPGYERYKLLNRWSGKEAAQTRRVQLSESGRVMPVHRLFERQAEQTPGAVAASDQQQSIDYAQLNAEANQLAHYLSAVGVGAGALVGLCIERSVEALVGMLAVMKAGGAYIPLDPYWPQDRIEDILEQAEPTLVLSSNDLMAQFDFAGLPVFPLDSDFREMALAAQSDDNLAVLDDEAGNIAYVIYTSGSTGKPKGVPVPHAGVSDYCLGAMDSYYEAELAGSLVVTNLCFDATVPSLYLPLLCGGEVTLFSEHRGLDDYWRAVASADKNYLLRLTPSHIKALSGVGATLPSCERRHVFVVGGESFVPSELSALRRVCPQAVIYNHYGPTEAIVGCSLFDTARFEPAQYASIPIGKAFGCTELYVLDEQMQPVPTGVAGQLYIGRTALATGYLGNQAMSDEKFVANPFGSEVCARLYASGDRVRWLADGNLEYLERSDSQVKVRGYRIELGEIEARLTQVSNVADAAVSVVEHNGSGAIVAYFVPKALIDAETDLEIEEFKQNAIAELNRELKAGLPNYMIPAVYVMLDAMPLSRNGKVDRTALPQPKEGDWHRAAYVAPRNEQESRLCDIWQQVLNLGTIGVHDDFFALGGHSLLATQMVSLIRELLGLEVPIRTVFEYPTIAEFVPQLAQFEDKAVLSPIVVHPQLTEAPLSYAQQRLWFIDKLEAGGAQYNIPSTLVLKGALNLDAFEQAVAVLIERHQVLRSVLVEQNGEVMSVLKDRWESPVKLCALQGADEAERLANLKRQVVTDAEAPFDLSADLMLRVNLYPLAADHHLVTFTMHHIASDGWSSNVIVDEFCRAYEALCQGEAPALAPLAVQYRDYALWQREMLDSGVRAERLDYWQARLAGAPELHSLPLDHPRARQQSFRGDRVSAHLGEALSLRIKALCQTCDVTPFMLLQSAFALLIGRYGHSSDIVMGTPVSGRNLREIEPLVGFFANTLVLRTELDGADTFRQLLGHNKDHLLAAFDNGDLPFEFLVEQLAPERSLSHNPLFQILFVLQNPAEQKASLPGLEVSHWENQDSERLVKFDLELNISDSAQGLHCNWIYNSALFERASMAAMSDAYRCLLEHICDNVDAELTQLSLTGEAQLSRMARWNDTGFEYPLGMCIHELIDDACAEHATQVAVRFDDETLSYGDLSRRANRLARHLQALGVCEDAPVIVHLERSIDMVVAILAVLKAGGAYVPVVTDLPQKRIDYILADTQATVVLSHEQYRERFADVDALVCLDQEQTQQQLERYSDDRLATPLLSDSNLAYVIYTSGSTGQPKGVCVEHRALVNRIRWMQRRYPLDAQDKVLQKTPFGFDVSVWEFVWSLSQGAELYMARPEGHKDPVYLRETLETYGITTLHFVPSMLKNLLDTAAWPSAACVRQVFCSGEALGAELVAQFRQQASGVALHNLYGPTEAAIDVSSFDCSCLKDGASVPVGKPIDNVTLDVVDSNLQLLPTGAVGELLIGGVALARGYLNKPEADAAAFVETVLGGRESARYYRTGDLARWNLDGELEYFGRIDAQVKIRGHRIELDEIKVVAMQHPALRDGVAIVSDAEQLLLYVVADGNVERAELKAFLAERLPVYMVPDFIIAIDEVPVTANGKLDRKALPSIQADQAQNYVAPATELQRALLALWPQAGEVKSGIEDSFFAMGGHSLAATRLLSDIRERYRCEVPLRAFYQQPTVAALASLIEQHGGTGADDELKASGEGEYPLSFAQKRLWFVSELDQDDGRYNIPMAYRIAGGLNIDWVGEAVALVAARHEILRSRFVKHGAEPVQQVLDSLTIKVASVALNAEDDSLQEYLQAFARTPFDIVNGPLLRVALIELSDDTQVLAFTIHHLVSDGWSMAILADEFATAYSAIAAGKQPAFTPLTLQYGDFARWQQQQLDGQSKQALLEYWGERLEGIPQLHSLSTDFPRPAQQSFAGSGFVTELGEGLSEQLAEFCRSREATPFMVLQSVFALLLSHYSNERDIVMGTPIAGRTRQAFEPLIGCFLNTLVLRNQVDLDESFDGLLSQTKHHVLGAFEHQALPFESIVESIHPDRSLSHNAVYQIVFAVQNMAGSQKSLEGLSLAPLKADTVSVDYDLALHVTGDKALSLNWSFCTALFARQSIERMADNFKALLANVLAAPQQPMADVALLGSAERALVTQSWCENKDDSLKNASFVELFESVAAEHPERIAVYYGDDSMSYGELDLAANRIANFLCAQQMGAGKVIALSAEPAIETVAALLGILKSGAAYLPVDPNYPEERFAYVVENAAADLLLTQEHLMEQLPLDAVACLPIDGDLAEGLFDGQSDVSPCVEGGYPAPESVAYIIYTSGSTGKPKGVKVPHRGLSNLAQAQQKGFGILPESKVLQFASISFDAAVSEWSTTLCCGAAMVLMPWSYRLEQPRFAATLTRFGVTHLTLPPAFVDAQGDWQAESVNMLAMAGEALSLATLEKARRHYPNAAIVNAYGATENSVCSSMYLAAAPGEPASAADIGGVAIGSPLANTRCYVLNRYAKPCPVGVVGELYVGGPGLALGYMGDPSLEQGRFVEVEGQRLYRTGDLVRWRGDGQLVFVGREDGQFKLRGYRIEAGEVESALLKLPHVLQSHVALAQYRDTTRFVAYLVLETEALEKIDDAQDRRALFKQYRQALKAELAEYMVPEIFKAIDSIPLNVNGKVDGSRLPALGESDFAEEGYVEPQNEVQRQLCEIWQQVLKLDRVGIEHEFFAVGGDSIQAIQIVARAKEIGLVFTVKELFRCQTVGALEPFVVQGGGSNANQEAVAGEQPLLPIQAALLEGERSDKHHYNQSVLLEVPAGFNVEQLRTLVEAIVTRHDALRLTFEGSTGRYQTLDPSLLEQMVCHHRLGGDSAAAKAQLMALCDGYQAGFELSRGPLFKAVLFELDQGGRLFLVAHHLLIDGVSWRVLLADLQRAYAQLGAGNTIELAAKTDSLQDWGRAVAEAAEQLRHSEERDYWEARLAQLPPVDGAIDVLVALDVSFGLDSVTTEQLLGQSNRPFSTQINELLLSCLLVASINSRGLGCLPLKMEGHGRDELYEGLDVSETVGWFTTVYPLVLTAETGADFASVIREVKAQYRALPNGGVGYGMLRYLVKDPAICRLSERLEQGAMTFNYLGQFNHTGKADSDFPVAAEPRGRAMAEQAPSRELSLSGLVAEGVMQFRLEGLVAADEHAALGALMAAFETALKDCVAYCADFVDDQQLLAEQAQEAQDDGVTYEL